MAYKTTGTEDQDMDYSICVQDGQSAADCRASVYGSYNLTGAADQFVGGATTGLAKQLPIILVAGFALWLAL